MSGNVSQKSAVCDRMLQISKRVSEFMSGNVSQKNVSQKKADMVSAFFDYYASSFEDFLPPDLPFLLFSIHDHVTGATNSDV